MKASSRNLKTGEPVRCDKCKQIIYWDRRCGCTGTDTLRAKIEAIDPRLITYTGDPIQFAEAIKRMVLWLLEKEKKGELKR